MLEMIVLLFFVFLDMSFSRHEKKATKEKTRRESEAMVEIALQGDSKGILYEGYTKAFKQCIFEEGDVEGKNERYEFRCDYDLECCGRTCCIPEPATIPLWLMILFIIAALLLLAALLAFLTWLLAKWWKSRPKKEVHAAPSSAGNKYSALRNNGDLVDDYGYHEQKYSTPDDIYSAYGRKYDTGSRNGGYRNGYGNGYGNGRNLDIERVGPDDGYRRREYAVTQNYLRRPSNNVYDSDNGSMVRHGVHETVEESFKSEIVYERPVSTDSQEML
ncbi:hypothetical protein CAEBREN_12209 [Caenorhabditis brenneri]|uniref:CX domain-containing protein n=1 Tax=Caenorhabditis brenneri TaxID=135651 RepID=G0MQL6_CAEBE|nr:hypothetical protein CAEBREN_12209 [Caenorhabditis brenneri]